MNTSPIGSDKSVSQLMPSKNGCSLISFTPLVPSLLRGSNCNKRSIKSAATGGRSSSKSMSDVQH
jgi:hypothetical protein